jgi:hypothetical protein
MSTVKETTEDLPGPAGDLLPPSEGLPATLGPDKRFARRLLVATLALLFVVLTIYLLDRLGGILQPLLIACFILYALHPIKNWLQRLGLPTWMAYTLILSVVLALLVSLGGLAYGNLYRLNPERLAAWTRTSRSASATSSIPRRG